jgi:putative Holliday junction resolvase
MGRVLAIDLGSRNVGVAISDEGQVIAQPLGRLPAEPRETLAERLVALAAKHEADEFVVGLPRRLDGGSGPQAHAARILAGRLRELSGGVVCLVDERLTSVQAERSLLAAGESRARRRELSDQVAAALILQHHLAAKARREG